MEITNNSLKISALLLAAGLGTRLKPLTDQWPKCLMPIRKKALLEIWLDNLAAIGISDILVNLHYHAAIVEEFLHRPKFAGAVKSIYEKELLGTAGTLIANRGFFGDNIVLMAHADNLCLCDFEAFRDFHLNKRPAGTAITMMTFQTPTPETCGIVELDPDGVVQKFHEKVKNPPGNLANAAIYLIDPEVINWTLKEKVSDFSTQVLPKFLGRIATWENKNVMRDIGNTAALKAAQSDAPDMPLADDTWQNKFMIHPVHALLEAAK